MRPIILNGIEDVVTRPDLADRAIVLSLTQDSESARRAEAEILAAFEAERPRILGALLDAVAHGLKRLPSIRLDKLPRLADFALWATACETALWQHGTFRAAYYHNLEEALKTSLRLIVSPSRCVCLWRRGGNQPARPRRFCPPSRSLPASGGQMEGVADESAGVKQPPD